MKIAPFLLPICVALAPQGALAKFTFLSKPSKIVACELTLKGAHQSLSQNQNILPVIRDINYRIQRSVPGSTNDGIAYPSFRYHGDLEKIKRKEAELMVQRLNGLEESILNPGKFEQYFVSEIRGQEDIAKALSLMTSREEELQSVYKDIRQEFERTKMRSQAFRYFWDGLNLFQVGIAGFVFGGTADMLFFMDPELAQPIDKLIMLMGSVYAAYGFKDYFKVNRLRLDAGYLPLKKALRKAAENPSEDDFFMSSIAVFTPTEFHRYLMQKEGQEDPVSLAKARQLAFEAGELSLWERQKANPDLMQAELMMRFIGNAGDVLRLAFVDQIVYFDKQSGEPVWVGFYRAFRGRPPGRKPTRKKQVQNKKKEAWAPGALPAR